jgi:hypothetical protein
MQIQIIHCEAVGPQFKNLTDGSIHEVIDIKYSEYNGRRLKSGKYIDGYWVKGVGENVVVLEKECKVIE